MLIVFGSTLMELRFKTETLPQTGGISKAESHSAEPGGKGANQALAACRAGAKVALVSKVGDDDYATNILGKLRREGITTSGIGKGETPTGCSLQIIAESGDSLHTIAFCANKEIESQQVPDEILSEQTVILLQTEIDMNVNAAILEKTKKAGATTIMNLSPSIELSQKTLKHLDYLIVNRIEAQKLAVKLGLTAEQDSIKIAQALAAEGQLNCIITLGGKGSLAVEKNGKGWKVEALNVKEAIYKNGAEDVYSGTFAACIYAGLPLERALKRASIAASLTCTKPGGQRTFPFLADIESELENLADAEKLEL